MREKRLNEEYRKEENAQRVEYKKNLPEDDDARRLLAVKSNSLGHLRRKNKEVKRVVTAWNWFRQMAGPGIRKEMQTATPGLPGPEFGHLWGAEVGRRWRGMNKEEKMPYKDRQAADEVRFMNDLKANELAKNA
jgi:hypothetical protein